MMEMTDFSQTMRQYGLKSTKIRLSILAVLSQNEQPLDAEQIFSALKAQNAAANLSTVYRALDSLAEKKLITAMTLFGAHRMLYTFNRPTHRHYLICLGCKRMLPVEGCPLAGYEKQLERQTGFLIAAHQLDLYGHCPACLQKNSARGEMNNAAQP